MVTMVSIMIFLMTYVTKWPLWMVNLLMLFLETLMLAKEM